MNSPMPRIVMAVALVTLGWLSWRAGRIEGRMAEAGREVATLRFAMPVEAYDEIDGAIGYLDRIPQAALGRSHDVERQRATAQYWLAQFDTLFPEHDTDGQLVSDDPERLLVGANAVYRATILAGEREALAAQLEGVLAAYADVIGVDPTSIAAAYNYEFVARLRDALSAGRQLPHARLDPASLGVDPAGPSDSDGSPSAQLPIGPTLHGAPGAPPVDMTIDELSDPFRVYVPLRPTEREESNEAGKGPAKDRKG